MTAKASKSKLIMNITSVILHLLVNFIFYVLIIMVIIKCSKVAYDFSYQLFGNVAVEAEPGTDVTVEIKKGESTYGIAKKLELNRIIVNKYSFYVKAKITKQVIMPGTYVVNTSMNYEQILEVITKRKAVQDETATE